MGLLRTAARVSVATHVHGNIRRRQEKRWAAEDQATAARAASHAKIPERVRLGSRDASSLKQSAAYRASAKRVRSWRNVS